MLSMLTAMHNSLLPTLLLLFFNIKLAAIMQLFILQVLNNAILNQQACESL